MMGWEVGTEKKPKENQYWGKPVCPYSCRSPKSERLMMFMSPNKPTAGRDASRPGRQPKQKQCPILTGPLGLDVSLHLGDGGVDSVVQNQPFGPF